MQLIGSLREKIHGFCRGRIPGRHPLVEYPAGLVVVIAGCMGIVADVDTVVDAAVNTRNKQVHNTLQRHEKIVQFSQFFHNQQGHDAVEIDEETTH